MKRDHGRLKVCSIGMYVYTSLLPTSYGNLAYFGELIQEKRLLMIYLVFFHENKLNAILTWKKKTKAAVI